MALSTRRIAKQLPFCPDADIFLIQDIFGLTADCRPSGLLSLRTQLNLLSQRFGVDEETGFSVDVCRSLALIAEAAYEPHTKGESLPIRDHLNNHPTDSRCDSFFVQKTLHFSGLLKDVEVLIVENGHNEIVVAFRGTEAADWGVVRDLITDLQFVVLENYERKPGPIGDRNGLHRGFYESYKRIRDSLVGWLESVFKRRKIALYLTGHSLGGAIATVAALDFAIMQDEGMLANVPLSLWTFGSPRVMNSACYQQLFAPRFGDHSDRPAFFVINQSNGSSGDIAPTVPLTARYASAGPIVLLQESEYKVVSGQDFTANAEGAASAHFLSEYIRRLDALRDSSLS